MVDSQLRVADFGKDMKAGVLPFGFNAMLLYCAAATLTGSDVMRSTAKLVVALAALMATITAANARDTPRNSARQPDFSTCSNARQACVVGTARRGHSQAGCDRAYRTCMRTGIWDTYDGMYGRRVSGLPRR